MLGNWPFEARTTEDIHGSGMVVAPRIPGGKVEIERCTKLNGGFEHNGRGTKNRGY